MVVAVKIEIENAEIFDQYAKIIAAQAKNSQTDATNATFAMEKILARTIFRGTVLKSGAGESNPDFLITNDGLNALLGKMDKTSAELDNFQKFIQDAYGEVGTPLETKILTSSKTKDIKLGIFTPTASAKEMQYYDFATGSMIDTTRYSVVQELRASYANEPVAKPAPELSSPLKKSDLMNFFRNVNPGLVKVIQKDSDVTALSKILDATPQQKQSSDEINRLIESINNKWAKASMEAELGRLSSTGKLFDYVMQVPALKSQFYLKSRVLSMLRSDNNNKVTALLLTFPLADFNNKLFSAKYEEGQIKVFIKSDIEKIFLNQLVDETIALRYKDSLDEYEKQVATLAATGTVKDIKSGFSTIIQYKIPTGGSIPMSSGNFFNIKRRYVRQPFIKKGTEQFRKYAEEEKRTIASFLPSEYLSLLVRKKVVQAMPSGPIGGPPKSKTILTYRTGRFANSIQLMVDYKTRVVRYYYNPIYYAHEKTSRDPRKIITQSISEVMKEKFNQEFNITERIY